MSALILNGYNAHLNTCMMCGMIQEVVAQQQRQTKQKCLAQSDRHTERSTERLASVSNGGDNMTTNCSFDGVDNLMRYFELAIYIPIFPFGLVLNVVALFVFCIFLRKWTESTIYMTSLALMDLLLLFPLPFKMHATNHFWPAYLQPLCSVLESLYFFGIYGSIYTIMCIAVDRWVAICHPFKAKVFGFLVPALVVVYCSVQTIWALQQSGQHSPQSRACVKIIYSSLSAFLVPFTPSHLGILLQFLVHQEVIQDCSNQTGISLFIQIAMCLSNITCCLDALCYYFIAHEVRSTRNTFRLSIISQRRPTFSTSEV
ncbi:G-protein coupled receptor 55 isoform X2 [Micropterus dolomieu]|uniref:G-protein coupled receptor 55 isoform X2 n=1 Tax=Micropterus dolomieu TaxID=147949 RepID=UPI001E8D3132|nr:G-protein coupled receptor 55 isoform X2 [Micropterus dolomieu]